MAGQMLYHRQDASGLKTFGDRPGDSGDLAGLLAVGAIANNRIAAGCGNIGDWHAINVNTQRSQVGGDQMTGEPRVELRPDSRGDFHPVDFDALLRFTREAAGRVSGVTLFERGEALRGTRVDG